MKTTRNYSQKIFCIPAPVIQPLGWGVGFGLEDREVGSAERERVAVHRHYTFKKGIA